MTVLLAVAGAVAVAVAVAAAALARRGARQVAVERARVEELQGRLRSEGQAHLALQQQADAAAGQAAAAADRAEEAERRAAEADRRAAALERRSSEADQRAAEADRRSAEADQRAADADEGAADAERRSAEAERRAEDAERRAAEADRRAAALERSAPSASRAEPPAAPDADANLQHAGATDRSSQAGALWQLERVRLEREWREVAGASAPLPVPWDGTVGAAMAVELELIREVIGTPSHLDMSGDHDAPDPVVAVTTTRLAGELLRCLARTGEELAVTVAGPSEVRVTVAVEPGTGSPDVGALAGLACAAGGTIDISADAGGLHALLRIPPSAG